MTFILFRQYTQVMGLVLLSLSLFGCSHPEGVRFQPSGLNAHFEMNPKKPYKDYVQETRQMIAQARVDLKHSRLSAQEIIDGNAPYILPADASCTQPSKRAVLMIHGLTDSPYSLKESARFFQKNCFYVYGLLLTGHGTRPGDLRNVRYQDWVKQVQYAMQQLRQNHQALYLGGFSTGGVLAIDYILSHPEQTIAGLFLLSPALNITSYAALARWAVWFKPWLEMDDDLDVMKYESFATNGVVQLYALIQQMMKKLADHPDGALKKVPVFAAFTAEDQTIKALDALTLLIKHTDEQRRHLLVYYQDVFPTQFRNIPNVFGKKSTMPKQHVLDLSHLSLGGSENDRWYGRQGLYRNCLHYIHNRQSSSDYHQCKTDPQVLYGEKTKKNLEQGIMARITFNPFLQDLFESAGLFFR